MALKWTDATPPLTLAPLPQVPSTPLPVDGAVDVWIAPAVYRAVLTHLRSREVEQGGLLVGQAFAHPATGALAHVRVTGSAAAADAEGTAFSLRMGTGVWQAAQALLQPGELILGWYHSHPGLTAFFSDTDRRTQRAFFKNAYSIGWVVDPTTAAEALFLGPECLPISRGPDRLQTEIGNL
jgi:proteasome lid subunit RPN8/RPN11